ncbi:MAG: hypothetical protein MUP70_06840 [Candidatus Aminicenantes bacterium]|nr:hypothetical protein [Candidatus Aminicenantes bacterium]
MKKFLLWFLAFIITAGAAVYQRMTGPTYPLRGMKDIAGTEINFRLPRTHETAKDCMVKFTAADPAIEGFLLYKRFNTDDDWIQVPMVRSDDSLTGALPFQPPAGKLEYRVVLSHPSAADVFLSDDESVVIRFKGAVPGFVLLPHILIMFMAMLFSNRAGIEALRPKGSPRKLVIWTTGLMIAGGMILGPLVQYYAFGALWTGFPFGGDMTDNKTLFAVIAWILALVMGRKGKKARGWVLGASIITLAVYMIPHSLFGSELDYSKLPAQK